MNKQPPERAPDERRGPARFGRRPLDRLAYRRQFLARRDTVAWRLAGVPRSAVRLDPEVDRPGYEPLLADLDIILPTNRIVDQPPERQAWLARLLENAMKVIEEAAAKGDRRAITEVLQHRIAMAGRSPFAPGIAPAGKGPKRS